MLQIGSYVDGKYKVLNKIGQGGMSIVYLALNERANKTWAIKEVRKDGKQDFTTVKQGLIAETNILKSLNHKYLPSIVDVIDDGDSFLIVMDYIQGKSLDKILKTSMEKENLPIALEDVISWGKQLCEVFYYLHTRPQPIIYRDMKPANVMLKPDGEISLIDFGTARTYKQGKTEDTTCLGTPGYASPEQYGGKGESSPQSDIYCLGATLHHLITGRNPSSTPFNFPKITQCRPSLMDETPREDRNKLLGLEMIIEKCTQYDASDRYGSCLEMLYDLEHIEELSIPYRKKLKHKLIGFGACAAAAVLCGGLSFGTHIMETKAEQSGYEGYIERANKSDADEKLVYLANAIAIDPSESEAYLLYLEALQSDNEFSGQDSVNMLGLLNQTETGNHSTNAELLKEGSSVGYVKLAYELGKAYYYAGGAGKPNGDKERAGQWFLEVIDSSLTESQLENEGVDLNMAKQFQNICTYYEKLGQEDQTTGEQIYSYSEFWDDLNQIVADQPETISTDSSERMTQLRCLQDVSYQLYAYAENFIRDAGMDEATFEAALGEIENRVKNADCGTSSTSQSIKDTTLTTISAARDRIGALYAANSKIIEKGEDES